MILSPEYKAQWSLREKLALRLIFTYCTLYILLLLLGFILEGPMRWFANNILNWGGDFKIESTGSGDRSYDYVRLAFHGVLTLIVSLTWSVLDRKRPSYNELFYWFQVLLRFTLFIAMMLYGLVKVFKGQFSDPTLVRLMEPVGELSPMGLAWTFMGHSMGYNIFIGFAEVLGGLLVIFRKTVTLGALITVGVMSNVAMMNFTYDIPVKLFSIHLVLLASVLVLADRQRILNVLLRNKAAAPVQHYVPFTHSGLKKLINISKVFVTGVVLLATIVQCFAQFKLSEQSRKSVLYGIWEAEVFVQNSDTIPPLLTDNDRWRYLILDQREAANIAKINETLLTLEYEMDTTLKELVLYENNGSEANPFQYKRTGEDQLHLLGVYRGDSLSINFRRKPLSDFTLLNRGFHWVNEKPFKP